jgi:dihydroorotate dehydrogenase electron transfer subunit
MAGRVRYPLIVTSDDGSLGLRGRVTDGLERWAGRRGGEAAPLVCACGPTPMLRAVSQLCARLGIEAQLCIETTMACGLGTCLSCVVRVHDAAREAGWRWALSCSEGPVFSRERLLDYA